MAFQWKEVGLILFSVLVTTLCSNYCTESYTVSVRKTRQEAYVGTCYYSTGCGWWGRRCRRSRSCTQYRTASYYVSETRYRQGCCPGYTGSTCTIPVCQPKCQNNAVCTSPGTCYCRSGSSGSTCELTECSASNDCYPGTCRVGTSQCVCSSGFSGTSCSQIREGGSVRACNLEFSQLSGSDDQASCFSQGLGITKDVYTGVGLPQVLKLIYEVEFKVPEDLPPLPSEYMVKAPFGLIESYMELSLYNAANNRRWGPESITCVIETGSGGEQPSADNPHKSLNCHKTQLNWPTTGYPANGDVLNVDIVSKSGGFKEYVDEEHKIHKRPYTGSTSTSTFKVTFDLEPPTNCMANNNCPSTKPFACEFIPDVSKYGVTKLDFGGWTDGLSGLKEFRYTVYTMDVDSSGLLKEGKEYIGQRTIPAYADAQLVEFQHTGMYSAIFEAVDNTGNSVKARAFFLYDNSSHIEADDDYPLLITGAQEVDSLYWVTSSDASVTVTWKNRYRNAFLHNNKLLAQVKQRTDVTFDDDHGSRKASAVENLFGISNYAVAFSSSEDSPAYDDFTFVPPSQEKHTQSVAFGADSALFFHLAAEDVLGNSKFDVLMIRMDNTEAELRTIMQFEANSGTSLDESQFVSSLAIHVDDLQSGIHEITFKIIDLSAPGNPILTEDSQKGQLHPQYTRTEQCTTSGECYCITGIACYLKEQVILIDNCQFRNAEGHTFRMDFNVMNGAGLSWQSDKTHNIGTVGSLRGLGQYPEPKDLRAIELPNNVYQMNITWQYLPSCYPKSSVEISYDSGGKTRTVKVLPSLSSALIDGLRPSTDYVVTVRFEYEGGEIVSGQVDFRTRSDGVPESLTGNDDSKDMTTVWIGAGIGAVALLIIVALLTCIVFRWRKKESIVPPGLRHSVNNVTNRLSMIGHARGAQAAPSSGRINTPNRAYCTNEYNYDEVASKPKKEKTYRVAYKSSGSNDNYAYSKGNTDEDLYTYDGPGYASWKLSNDTVKVGDFLKSGSFAEIHQATLSKTSSKTAVVAKMNIVGASADDKALMNEKMTFLSKVPAHENILMFVAAVPEPDGPMLILEYCDKGTLLDWLKRLSSVTGDSEEQMHNFAEQVAKGMAHLHRLTIVHKHLSSKNVLLATDKKSRLVAKVAGFGPAKGDKAERIDEKKGDRVKTKWLAPEQFHRKPGKIRHASKATDIWTYGIFLHELYSKGQPPYKSLTDSGVIKKVSEGYREPKNDNCNAAIYNDIMLKCWDEDPSKRPAFEIIVKTFPLCFGTDQEEYTYRQATYASQQDEYSNVDF